MNCRHGRGYSGPVWPLTRYFAVVEAGAQAARPRPGLAALAGLGRRSVTGLPCATRVEGLLTRFCENHPDEDPELLMRVGRAVWNLTASSTPGSSNTNASSAP